MSQDNVERCKTCDQPIVHGAKSLILYFTSDQDMDEFIALVKEAKPDMKTVKVTDLKEAR